MPPTDEALDELELLTEAFADGVQLLVGEDMIRCWVEFEFSGGVVVRACGVAEDHDEDDQ